MPPLIQEVQGQAGTAPPAPGAGAPPPDPAMAGGEPAGDMQQTQQLEEFKNNAYTIIYGGKSASGEINPAIAKMLRSPAKGDGDTGGGGAGPGGPVESLAATAAGVGARVAASAVERGVPIDGPGVVLPGTLSLVENLADVAVREGIYDYSEQELGSAAMATAENLFEQTQQLGLWKQEDFDATVQEVLKMNQDGQLDQIAPNTSAAMGAFSNSDVGGPPGGAPMNGGGPA